MINLLEITTGELVVQDYRTAAVFERFGIDFCCQGNRSIKEACENAKINMHSLLEDLNAVISLQEDKSLDYISWPLDLLADYIEKKHHRYVEEKIPLLGQYLDKLCSIHGKKHPELLRITNLFNQSSGEIITHLKKEEFILFPYVRKMACAQRENIPVGTPPFGTVHGPVQMMMHEHHTEGDRFRKISALSNRYTPPGDACNTYKVTYSLLKEFEADLHFHIHLENNILFPKAIALEKSSKIIRGI